MNWFKESYCESIKKGWAQRDGTSSKRDKAVLAVSRATSMLDEDPLRGLPRVTFFSPALELAGEVRSLPFGKALIYLAPTLEFESQADVNFTVAHEIAHVLLGHYLDDNVDVKLAKRGVPHENQPHEIAADEWAAKWGFKKRQRGSGWLSKILGWYEAQRREKRDRYEKAHPYVENVVYQRPDCEWEERRQRRARKLISCPICRRGVLRLKSV